MIVPVFSIPYAPPYETEDLFLSKILSVVLVGEIETVLHGTLEEQGHQGHQSRLHFTPKDSSTAKHDVAAARFFYQHCQMLGVSLTVVTDEVGFACQHNVLIASLISQNIYPPPPPPRHIRRQFRLQFQAHSTTIWPKEMHRLSARGFVRYNFTHSIL